MGQTGSSASFVVPVTIRFDTYYTYLHSAHGAHFWNRRRYLNLKLLLRENKWIHPVRMLCQHFWAECVASRAAVQRGTYMRTARNPSPPRTP